MKKLVEEKQPFGEVKQMRTDIGGSPCEMGYSSKPLGDTTVRSNHGHDHAPSFANPNPGAQAQAARNANNPMAFTGHPVKR